MSNYEQFLKDAYIEHQEGKTWVELCETYKKYTHEEITPNALRKRVKRFNKETNPVKSFTSNKGDANFEQFNSDGTYECSKDTTREVIADISKFKGNKDKIIDYLGYNTSEWELVTWRVTQWDGGSNNEQKFSLKYKIKPKSDISSTDILNAVKTALNSEIAPLKLVPTHKLLNTPRLMEIPPVELHLGKIADKIQTGEEYNFEIARGRFYAIFDEVLTNQEKLNCDKCLLVIGSDFFNSESNNCTSVHQIPQQNNIGYIKMFTEGIKMYRNVLVELRKVFNSVDVMLCAGNHARAMETFLYIALEQAFSGDKVVHFIENYRQTQAYEYGENVIFYNHGDANLKQVIKSIPAEFGKEWGTHKFRELHLGHLHKEVTVDDDGGMITRRVGSPCSTDAWHDQNRYVGAVKKHEIFIWDKNYGLNQLIYIPII